MHKKAQRVLASVKRPVLAGHNHGKPSDVSLALMVCASCSTEVLTNYTLHAACPVCAETLEPSPEVIRKDDEGRVVASASGEPRVKKLKLTAEKLAELPVVAACDNCGTDFRGTEELATAMDSHEIFCPVCAGSVTVQAADEADAGEDEDEGDADAADADEGASDDVAEDDMSDEDMEEIGDEEDNDPAATEMTDEEYSEGLRTESAEFEACAGCTSPDSCMEAKACAMTTTAADADDDTAADEFVPCDNCSAPKACEAKGHCAAATATATDPVEAPEAAQEIDVQEKAEKDTAALAVNALAIARANANSAYNFVMASSAPATWYLFADNKPVAFARKDGVKAELQGMFETPTFGRAFAAAAAAGLSDEIVADFGLEPVVVEQPMDKAVEQKIAEEVEARAKTYTQATDEIRAQFEQCVGIAAVGVNKGFFGDAQNPLRAAFVEALASNNLRNPERLVDQVLSQYGEDYLKTIISKALDLQKKTPDTLNEIASLVEASTYQGGQHHRASRKSEEVVENLSRGNLPISVTASAVEPADSAAAATSYQRLFRGLGTRRV